MRATSSLDFSTTPPVQTKRLSEKHISVKVSRSKETAAQLPLSTRHVLNDAHRMERTTWHEGTSDSF